MGANIDTTQGLRFPAGALVTAADDLVQRLDQLNAIGASLSAERDINRLLEAILTAAKTITRADGGTLYRVTEEKTLRFEIVRTSSLKYYLGGSTGNPVPFYPIQLYKDGRPNQTMVAAHAALTGRTVNIADAYTAEGFDFAGTRAFDAKTGYRSKSFLTVPMRNHEGEAIGVLQLINAQDPHSGEIVAFSSSDQRLAESLASQAAVALTNRMLANQLETIFARVQLIDTRFEVLKRDEEIESLKARAPMGRMEAAEEEARLRERLRRIDDDRKFLHACNIGSERMRDEDIEHVKRIAKYRWRDVSGHEADFLTVDEVKNLTIRAGTLTEDERKVINHHIVATIRMLEALPWPKHLTNVPEYAGGHHERMDGKGYPKELTREQMSVQARCMGIADIFEALTAKDRPYKKGKTLSESLEILGRMRQNHHIDPDLFDVFVRRKVYRRYAEIFLDKEQIDEVDESKIPGYTP